MGALHVAASPAAWALLGTEERGGAPALVDFRHADLAMDRLDVWRSVLDIEFDRKAVQEQLLLSI